MGVSDSGSGRFVLRALRRAMQDSAIVDGRVGMVESLNIRSIYHIDLVWR